MVVAAFQVPAADVTEVVREEVEDAVDPVVRIGDGARLVGARLIDEIQSCRWSWSTKRGQRRISVPAHAEWATCWPRSTSRASTARKSRPDHRTRGRRTPDDQRPLAGGKRYEPGDQRGLARQVATGALTVEEALSDLVVDASEW